MTSPVRYVVETEVVCQGEFALTPGDPTSPKAWFFGLVLGGKLISVCFGDVKPEWTDGTRIKITFEAQIPPEASLPCESPSTRGMGGGSVLGSAMALSGS